MNKVETRLGDITINSIERSDIEHLLPVLYESVVSRDTGEPLEDEIRSILAYMYGAPDKEGRLRNYLVARDNNGKPLGCMAVSEPEPAMLHHFLTTPEESDELLNAFVSKSTRGMGIGKQLLRAACELAQSRGKEQLIIHSGPRYELTAWEFYDANTDKDAGFIENLYGDGNHAKTWSIRLFS